MKIKDINGTIVPLEKKELFRAGQAIIYKIKNKKYVAKVYHTLSNKKRYLIEKKILFMIDNQPFNQKTPQEIIDSIVWPISTLYDEKKLFIGFVMPFIENSIELSSLVIPRVTTNHNSITNKFRRQNNNIFFKQRLTICYNIASVLHVLHEQNKYVVVDLKPQNMLIDVDGRISLIDIDSIQVQASKDIYFADAWTEDYCPPEFFINKISPKKQLIKKSWDYFSFANSAYQVLFQLPAFSGTVPNNTTIAMNIENRCFVHGRNKSKFSVVPSPHFEFNKLDREIKQLFIDSLDGDEHCRPDFTEWKRVLLKFLNTSQVNIPRSNNPKNVFNVLNWFISFKTKIFSKLIRRSNLYLFFISLFSGMLVFLLLYEGKEVKVYKNIFNHEVYFMAHSLERYEILEKQDINNQIWEKRLIYTENGEKIGWVKIE